ncbi:Piwi domain-containing protein [Pisolithus marmoratus]|nr:Piwi domain-containing protein [Pisolithus marmoratus]
MSQKEIIEDLGEMAQHIGYKKTSNIAPTQLIFFGGSVSEGQFQEVLDFKLKALQAKCHHVCFFMMNPGDADQSGNCPAGMVIDQVVAHLVEFDWYLPSHGSLLGTSQPAHYNILYDDNNFQADSLQSLAFALCHVYVRSICSVSILAPVYYADIDCSQAKNHYDPQGGINLSDTAMHTDNTGAKSALEAYKHNFKLLHNNMTTLMYFS